MGLASFETALLGILAIPLVMRYRIWPMEGTPYWLFGILFLILFANVVHTVLTRNVQSAKFQLTKDIAVWAVVLIVFGGIMRTAIVDRGKNAPGQNYQTHDIILQLEAALRYLGDGKNPYRETYFGTPMEKWHYAELDHDAVNPALYHFVMPPWYLLSAYPFYYVSMRTLGYFDGRMQTVAAAFGTFILLFVWIKNRSLRRLALMLAALNPAMTEYVIEGRSDLFALFFMLLALFLVSRKYLTASAFVFALAVLAKQTVWFAVPLYAVYAWKMAGGNMRKLAVPIAVAVLTGLAFVVPFLAWDAGAFIGSVVLYLSGNTAHGYPVSGYGLGMLLYSMGVIKNIHDFYPFAIWQAVLGAPALVLACKFILKKPTVSRLLMMHAASLAVIWYVSRYFNNSHAGYIAVLFALGSLFLWDEEKTGV